MRSNVEALWLDVIKLWRSICYVAQYQPVSMRIRPHKPIAAFSMIELVVAISLLMMMLGTLYSSWAAILQSTRTGSEAAANVQRERVTVQHVADALAGAVMVEDGEDWYRFKADTLSDQSSLSFIQRIPENSRKADAQSFRRVSFSVEPSANGREWELVRREAPVTQSPKATPVEPQELVRRVRLFKVELLDANGEWKTRWSGEGRLPRRARISVAVGPGDPKDVRVREVSLMSSSITHGGIPPKAIISAKEFGEEGFPVEEFRRHVFLIDKSGSMLRSVTGGGSHPWWSQKNAGVNRMSVAKEALLKTLNSMDEEDEFFIIFFNHGTDAMPVSAMLPATSGNVNGISAWVNSQEPTGRTRPSEALIQAFEQEPDVVWLLSDGEFSQRVHQLVQDMNPSRTVRINTLGFGTEWYYGSRSLRQMATENGGSFTLITTPNTASTPK